EHVHLESELRDAGRERARLLGLLQIAHEHLGSHPRGTELLGQGLKPIGPSRDQREVVAAVRELAGELLSDARGGARDKRRALVSWRWQGHGSTLFDSGYGGRASRASNFGCHETD